MHCVIQKDKSWVTDKAMCYFQRLECVWYAVVKQFTGRNFRVHLKSIRKLGRPESPGAWIEIADVCQKKQGFSF